MPASSAPAVTVLLRELRDATQEADVRSRLYALVYDELRETARRQLRREYGGQTLTTTALVNEAYFKLVDVQAVDWESRAHFFGIAARAMRQVLVSHARRRRALKRGGPHVAVTLDEDAAVQERAADLLALDEALDALAAHDAQLAQVVEYRFFGGLSEAEIGHLLGVSERTVHRYWAKARAYLARLLEREAP